MSLWNCSVHRINLLFMQWNLQKLLKDFAFREMSLCSNQLKKTLLIQATLTIFSSGTLYLLIKKKIHQKVTLELMTAKHRIKASHFSVSGVITPFLKLSLYLKVIKMLPFPGLLHFVVRNWWFILTRYFGQFMCTEHNPSLQRNTRVFMSLSNTALCSSECNCSTLTLLG